MPTQKKKKAVAPSHGLDLSVPVVDDLEIVHNKRKQDAANVEDDEYVAVLPGEAHDSDDDFETFDDMRDTARMAEAAARKNRRELADDDFGVAGLESVEDGAGVDRARGETATLEEVERDFAKLSSSQRLAMLKKESPEVLALMQDLKSTLSETQEKAAALQSSRAALRKGGAREHELVDFLETKLALMLTYCAHVTFYLLLKAEGGRVNQHPVVDRLVEIRTYLEKLRPVEQRLSYSLNRLLSGQGPSAPEVKNLRPVDEFGGETFQANKSRVVDDAKTLRRKAQARADRQRELDQQEEREMTRTVGKQVVRDGDLELLQAADPGTNEDADQFLTGMVEGLSDDEDEGRGLSLIEKLRAKVTSSAKEKLAGKPKAPKQKRPAPEEEDGMEDFSGDDEDVDYDALLADQYARDDEEAARKAHRPEYKEEAEVERRNASQKILSHRGLTKSRSKDKKNPRVARRTKFDKGSKGAAAQSRGARAEDADRFVGVPALKTNVTHTRKLA